VGQLLRLASEAGLLAAANHYRNRMVEVLLPGYTSGAFSNRLQGVAGSIAVSPVTATGDGLEVQVGTNQVGPNGAPYPVFWELGHLNTFTRKFEHQPRWEPTLIEEMGPMRERFMAAFRAVAQGASGFARVDLIAGARLDVGSVG
jgi:hypothetical protein